MNEMNALSGLSSRLVHEGVLSPEQVRDAEAVAKREGIPLTHHLITHRQLNSPAFLHILAEEFGLPILDLDSFNVDAMPVRLVSEGLIRKCRALPLMKRGRRLFVAISDPTDASGIDQFKFQTGLQAEPVLVADHLLGRCIDKALAAHDTSLDELMGDDLDDLNVDIEEEQQAEDTATDKPENDGPIVRLVNKLLVDGIRRGASDIHFEPYEKFYRVRMRFDGVLQEVAKPPIAMASRLTARIKVMSQLDISERRVPQDGRVKMKLGPNRAVDFRVSTCPTLFGEKVVLRILDPTSAQVGVDALGFDAWQKERLLEALHKPWGMILVTGPTGSGKTVTLYTGLNILNNADRNISTAEDPVEINLPGINQVPMNAKTGMTFANALRAFLRQDPDIIMVGEIRDLETAEIAVKAAQTGHMVLSTLHTNDAPQTLTRLVNMGVEPFNIASSVSLIIAQRLARRLCQHCKQSEDLAREAFLGSDFTEEQLAGATIYGPVGCDQCVNGYRGRVGIFQVMPVSEEMGRIIMAGGNSLELADQAAKEGVIDLRTSGLRKVLEGVTSLEEINRITRD